MRERLEQLKKELQRGEQELARLDRQRQQLRDTMLRIAGAIQVVEELLAQNAAPEQLEELAPAT
jgi:ABC-type transporter Mla subunit MlaD